MIQRWFLYSTREGVLTVPEPIKRLPREVRVSADGKWAELDDAKGVERVFVRLNDRTPPPRREGVAW